jgi:hypothetical protein
MNRREYLAALAAASSALAGCSTGSDGTGGETDDGYGFVESQTPPTTTTRESAIGPGGDVELPLPESALSRGAPKDAIPAIIDPVFGENWNGIELEVSGAFGTTQTIRPRLQDGDEVIGVERDGEARAYPLRILNWHEVVNDTFAGPLLVTYCPLCGSGVTAERTVDGEETRFGVSGLLWNSDLVMYDEKTDSLWSQILGQAVRGPKTGTRLSLVPSTLTTWNEWQKSHDDTEVLLPPPKSKAIGGGTRDYSRDPYGGYSRSKRIGIGNNDFDDDRLHPKAIVIGVSHDGESTAYPISVLSSERVLNDDVGGLPVVAAAGADESLFAYERTVDGETLTFEPGETKQYMVAGGSRWEIATGNAVDGPHEGTKLVRANDQTQLFWFAWLDFHPNTDLYGGGSG